MDNSWIKITRGIQKHWVYQNPLYLKAWITILLNVNFKDSKTLIETDLIECKRGESIHSLNTWSKLLGKGWTIQKVRTFFKLLEKDQMIITKGLRKTTRLSVCNYDTYQNEQQTANRQLTDSQQAANRQLTTREEGKERKEGKEEQKDCKRFPKNLKEVLDYSYQEKKFYSFDAWHFYESFEESNWCNQKTGKPIKSWKGNLRTWANKGYNKLNKSHQEVFRDYMNELAKEVSSEKLREVRVGMIKSIKESEKRDNE